MRTLLVCTLLASAFSHPGLPGTQEGEPTQPNFLVVVTDDQRFDQLGCAGHPILKTPVMDSLAARGVRFTDAFVTTPICAASRASIMTSRWEGTHGYTFGTPPMDETLRQDTYFARLKEAGYRTTFAGKWGVRFDPGERAKMFDEIKVMGPPYLRKKGELAHLTDRTADAAIAQLPAEGSEGPFCMTVSFNAPHAEDPHPDQYIPPADLAGMYDDAEIPVPPYATEGFSVLPPFLQDSMGRKRWGWRFDTREKQVRRTRDYWSMISGVDRAMGRILAEIEARGFAENTVVILMGDNGYFLGERGLAGKWLIYEESIRVPLIVYDPRPNAKDDAPKVQAEGTLDAMVLNVDIAPTLLELAGLPVPETYQGRSLVPLLDGNAQGWRTDFLMEHRFNNKEIPKSVGLRGPRWVYALYDEQEPPYEQLFDLENDPAQLKNLAGDEAHKVALETARARCAALRLEPADRAK